MSPPPVVILRATALVPIDIAVLPTAAPVALLRKVTLRLLTLITEPELTRMVPALLRVRKFSLLAAAVPPSLNVPVSVIAGLPPAAGASMAMKRPLEPAPSRVRPQTAMLWDWKT